MRRIVVVALGGNAIIKEQEFGDVTRQFANTRHALAGVVEIVQAGWDLVLTHGNGPQVGNILIRVEEARNKAYEIPLGVCVAQSQGEMGYMIGQSLQNHFNQRKIFRRVVTVLTQVLVDRNDPSFSHPTKPIGPFYNETQASTLRERGIELVDDAGRGLRRVVPSPEPTRVVEASLIRGLVSFGVVVIACGGGGVPVTEAPDGSFEGVDGVVDKDLASGILATEVGARQLVILTAVRKVLRDFGTDKARPLDRLTVAEARQLMAEGHFPPGSMGPKMQAAVEFLERGGERVLITTPEALGEAWNQRGGTWVVP